MFNRLLIGCIIVLAFARFASAADLVRNVPAASASPAAAPVYNWTGWYLGLNAGGGWGNNNPITNSVTSAFCNPNGGAFVGCVGAPSFSNAVAAAVPGQFIAHPQGFLGGAQIGYNFQSGPIVWGVETDFQGADIKGSDSRALTAVPVGFPAFPITVAGTGSQKLDWFGTLRGRLGWLPVNPLLVYVTGGLAYGHASLTTSFLQSPTYPTFDTIQPVFASTSEVRAGWTIGAGLECMVAPNWTVKGEYLYYDLGHMSGTPPPITVTVAGTVFTAVGVSSAAHFNGSIGRVGVNYHF
jgi:outer membrane immunogenic protein